MTTLDLLTRFKAHHGGITDYRAAKMLDIKHQTISAWKRGGAMSDETGVKVAESIGLDPVKVLIDLHLERDKGNATFQVWKAMAKRLEMAAMPVVVGLVGYGAGAFVVNPMF